MIKSMLSTFIVVFCTALMLLTQLGCNPTGRKIGTAVTVAVLSEAATQAVAYEGEGVRNNQQKQHEKELQSIRSGQKSLNVEQAPNVSGVQPYRYSGPDNRRLAVYVNIYGGYNFFDANTGEAVGFSVPELDQLGRWTGYWLYFDPAGTPVGRSR